MNFKDYMAETYSKQELADIAVYGCESGIASTLIYYSDTTAIYDNYQENLHEIISEYIDNFGESPTYIINNLNDVTYFKNAVVWFCAEYVAGELIDDTFRIKNEA